MVEGREEGCTDAVAGAAAAATAVGVATGAAPAVVVGKRTMAGVAAGHGITGQCPPDGPRANAGGSGWRGATPGSDRGGPRRGKRRGPRRGRSRCVRAVAPVWRTTPSLQRLPFVTWRHRAHAAIDWPGVGCVVGGLAVRPSRSG